ncbi:MAG: oligosaccharide flippase family protein [bacterium]|nr:oligosaccharide flippase family protein [bacterium]
MGATRTVAKNTILLTIGLLSGRALSVLLIRKMTPLLGTDGMGIWGQATDLTAILLVVANYGLGTLLTREVTRRRYLTSALFWSAVRVRWIIGAACYAFLLVFVRAMGFDDLKTAAVLVTGVAVFVEATAMACDAVLQAHEKVQHQTSSQILSAVLYFVVGWWALEAGHGIMGVVWANLASRVVRLAVVAPLMVRGCGPWRTDPQAATDTPGMGWMFRLGLPMFMATTFGIIYNKVDTIMLGTILGDTPAGVYVLGHRALDMMILVPSLFGFALFPAMARYGMDSTVDAVRFGERSLRFMLAAVVPLTLFLTFTAGPIIRWFDDTGEGAFADSIPVLMIVIWALPLQAANIVFNRLLVTADRERSFIAIGLVSMLVNVVLNILLIPRYSYFGASWATIASMTVSFVMHLGSLARTEHRPPLLRALLGPTAATALAWVATVGAGRFLVPSWGLEPFHLPVHAWGPFLAATGLTAVFYLAALAILRVIGRRDLDLLRDLLPGRRA